jgi:biopolymer transport protein ExbD
MAMSVGGRGADLSRSAVPAVPGSDDLNVNADINVTPMADVMLVLLIIFMVVTPALAGYTAILPLARTAAPEREERVTLGIDRQGRYFVERFAQGPVPVERLEQVLRQAYATRPEDHVLYLKADREVGYDKVLTAIDIARRVGVRRIGAITEVPKGAARASGGG